MKVCNGGEKMRNACIHQGENGRRERTRTTHLSSIKRVTRPFLQVSRCSRVKEIEKKVCCTCKFHLDLLLFFHLSRCLCRLALHEFIFCLNKL